MDIKQDKKEKKKDLRNDKMKIECKTCGSIQKKNWQEYCLKCYYDNKNKIIDQKSFKNL